MRLKFNVLKIKNLVNHILAMLITLFLSSCVQPSLAHMEAVICGRIVAGEAYSIKLFEPVFGYYNAHEVELPDIPDLSVQQDSFYHTVQLSQPTFVHMTFYTDEGSFINRADILLCPGDSLHLVMKPYVQSSSWITFGGTNAAGHSLFLKKNFNLAEKFQQIQETVDNVFHLDAVQVIRTLDSSAAYMMSDFQHLLADKQISNDFFTGLALYYQCAFYQYTIYPLKRDIQNEHSQLIIDELFTRLPPMRAELKTIMWHNIYVRMYYSCLAARTLGLKGTHQLEAESRLLHHAGKDHTVSRYLRWCTYIDDPNIKEDLWAMAINSHLKFAPGLVKTSTIEQFSELFPNSRWEPILWNQFSIKGGADTNVYVLEFPIEIVDSLSYMESLEEVLADDGLKNEMVLVDCWATWCGPCISAFAHNHKIDPFLKEHNIKRLYISLDGRPSVKNWEKAIDHYQLGGYHVIAGHSLITDLKELLGIGEREGFSIPRYFLLNGEGEIVEYWAAPPNNSEKLKKQINELLLKN